MIPSLFRSILCLVSIFRMFFRHCVGAVITKPSMEPRIIGCPRRHLGPFLRRRISVVFVCLITTLASPNALGLEGVKWLAGSAVEGGMIIGQLPAGSSLTLNSEIIAADKNGIFILGFHRDSDTPAILSLTGPDGRSANTTLPVQQRAYKIQRIDGLKSNHVTPPQSRIDRINRDAAAVRAARTDHDAGAYSGDFIRGFDMPVTGQITGVYGSQRILNGAPRQPHYGIDIAAPRGTPIIAPAGGRVTFVGDLYFSGWTVLITHGLGLNSTFLHMEKTNVAKGDLIPRGTVIGTVGSTGRSTGPHLDWRLDWQGRRLDASLVRTQIAEFAKNN
jgi:murein DD-endopeptidase MepM/ murein hydrolase activator NlpD